MTRRNLTILDIREQEFADLQGRLDPGTMYRVVDTTGRPIRTVTADGQVVGGAQARTSILDGALAGISTGWLTIAAHPERLAYQLDSGSTSTTFSIDVSADGVTSLGQAFTGSWARSDVAELTPPLMFANPQARFFRFNVLSGGPLSVSRGY